MKYDIGVDFQSATFRRLVEVTAENGLKFGVEVDIMKERKDRNIEKISNSS